MGPTTDVVTLLFTDLVESTALLERLGDDAAEELRRDHFTLLRGAVARTGGQEVKSLGDGLMVWFVSPIAALSCAVDIQRAIADHNQEHPDRRLGVRIGLHAGVPLRDGGDFHGTPVVVAKRLCDQAEGGQILAGEIVTDLVGSRGGFAYRRAGRLRLKGLADPVAAVEVEWEPARAVPVRPPVATPAHLRLTLRGRARVVPLTGRRITLGRHPQSDVVLEGDDQISRMHACVEDYGTGWCLKDLGSRNGTFVNGERLLGERILRHGDEVRIGSVRLRFDAGRRDAVAATTSGPRARLPELTRREREVLIALCRPLFTDGVVHEPASTRQIASELGVTEDAVKHHLGNLYDKFEIDVADGNRRGRLAREALLHGVVSRADAM